MRLLISISLFLIGASLRAAADRPGALVDPQAVQWERGEAPAVDYDLRYDFSKKMGKIVRIYYVDRNRAFGDLEGALRTLSTSR